MPNKEKIPVLVIDDEQSVRSSIARVIQRMGFAVDTASCTEDAIEKISLHSYTIYFSDLKMPGEDGVMLLQKIKQMNPHSFFILITGYLSKMTESELIKKGAFAFLEKPVQAKDIKKVIDKCITML